KAVNILRENKDLLDEISAVLLDKETIMGDEFMEIVYSKYPEKKEAYEKLRKEKELLKEQVMEKRKEKEEAMKQAKEEMLRLEKEQMSVESSGIEDLVSELEHASKEAEKNGEVSLDKEPQKNKDNEYSHHNNEEK
ncbi:MAG: ATP-dependent zinc metalloprotease FtsH, partial [Sarcina sp.]